MFVAAIVIGGPLRPRAIAFILVLSAVTVGYYAVVAPPQTVARVTHAGGGSGRTDIWSVASRVAAGHPLIGVGVGNFPSVEATYAAGRVNLPQVHEIVDQRPPVHNTYLELVAELGVVGLLAFGAVVVGSLTLGARALRTFVRYGERELEMLARGVIVAIVSLLTAFVFLSGEYEKSLWLLLGLSAALSTVARGVVRSFDTGPRSE
jgi:O-antigen ligase